MSKIILDLTLSYSLIVWASDLDEKVNVTIPWTHAQGFFSTRSRVPRNFFAQ